MIAISAALVSLLFVALGGPALATSVYTQQPTFSVLSQPTSIAFSLDGSQAYIARGNNNQCFVDSIITSTQLVVATKQIPCGVADQIVMIKMMPNGSALWVATDKTVYSLNPSTLQETLIIDNSNVGSSHLRGFSFSSDSSFAFISDLRPAVYRFSTSGTLPLTSNYTYSIATWASAADDAVVSPDGTRLLVLTTGPSSKVISFPLTSYGFDPPTVTTLTGTTARSAVFSADSSKMYIAVGQATSPPSNFGIFAADQDGNYGSTLTTSSMPTSLSLSPDGTTILASQAASSFSLVNVSTNAVTSQNLSGYPDGSLAAFNPTGASAYLAASGTSSILPLAITPPVGPGTPTPTPTPSPSPNTLPNTGMSQQSLNIGLFAAGGMLFFGGVLVVSSIQIARRRVHSETKPLN